MISTSPITSQILPGAVVETSSGSKYFLDPGRDQVLREFQAKQRDEARSAAMAGKAGGNRDASVATKTQQAKPKRSATIPLFRGTTISLFGGTTAKKKVPPQAQGPTTDPPPGSKPRATLSLFSIGGGRRASQSNKRSAAAPPDAPAGVPKVINWKRNFDGSISGFVTGGSSDSFVEGERIITSPLRKNSTVRKGSTVTTVSGSKYFLV